jgi:hypothetical protein
MELRRESGLGLSVFRKSLASYAFSENDHGASYGRYGVSQWRSRLKISFCEIFGVVQFSTLQHNGGIAEIAFQTAPGGFSPTATSAPTGAFFKFVPHPMAEPWLLPLFFSIGVASQ